MKTKILTLEESKKVLEYMTIRKQTESYKSLLEASQNHEAELARGLYDILPEVSVFEVDDQFYYGVLDVDDGTGFVELKKIEAFKTRRPKRGSE